MVIQLVMVIHHYHIHVIQLVMDIIPWYHVYIWDLDIHLKTVIDVSHMYTWYQILI
jgi:hypothetical protein